jgi:hypothetical protein
MSRIYLNPQIYFERFVSCSVAPEGCAGNSRLMALPRSTSVPPGVQNGWQSPKRMLIKAYRVESHRHGSVDFGPGPVLIGIVQFPANDGMEVQQREEEALELLAKRLHPMGRGVGKERTRFAANGGAIRRLAKTWKME